MTEASASRTLPTREDLLAHAEAVLDRRQLEEIRARHPKAGSERKYFETEKWLNRKWEAAKMLGLVGAEPLDILDLGTGAGHFPFICRWLGHRVWALDLPGIGVYDDLCRWNGTVKLDHRILPREPLPRFPTRFDLVTAFMLGFDTRPDGTLYTLEDWAYFLDEVRDNQLKPGGRLLLKLIGHPNRVGLKFESPELQDFFRSRNGRIGHDRYVLFEPLR